VHEVLAAHRGGVDDAVAGGPVAVVRAAERGAVGVGDLLVRGDVLTAGVLLRDDAAICNDGSWFCADGVNLARACCWSCLARFAAMP